MSNFEIAIVGKTVRKVINPRKTPWGAKDPSGVFICTPSAKTTKEQDAVPRPSYEDLLAAASGAVGPYQD